MTLLFLQTCDPDVYQPMLDITSATVQEYCARHRFGYSCYIGIIRGDKPWHAALNRIVLLRAIAASGFGGWVIYLDADAYIHDLAFDLGPILARNANLALLAAGSGVMPQQWWDINDGIVAINLGHPGGRAIVAGWNDRLDCITDAMLARERTWGDVANDQEMLHCVLRALPDAPGFVELDRFDIFNYQAHFIRQVLRADYSDFSARLEKLRAAVAQVICAEQGAIASTGSMYVYDEVVRSLYRQLFAREGDQSGVSHAVASLRSGEQTLDGQIASMLASQEFADCAGPALVAIEIDGVRVAALLADRDRPDVALAGFGSGRLGFRYEFTAPLDSGREHQVRVLNQTLGLELSGSPVCLSSSATEPLDG